MLSIDEAILHHEEIAEKNEADINSDDYGKYYKEYCLESAEYNRQLVEWLKELKALRENEDVKDIFKDCDTCKYLELDSDDYPCDRCMHRYINQYVYDDKREVNADADSD